MTILTSHIQPALDAKRIPAALLAAFFVQTAGALFWAGSAAERIKVFQAPCAQRGLWQFLHGGGAVMSNTYRVGASLLRQIFAKNFWLVVLAGLVLILLSYYVALDLGIGIEGSDPQGVTWPNIVLRAIREIGFALIVAAVIWTMFDSLVQRDSKDQWDGIVEKISQNVFAAMLKRELPEKLITEAFELILNQKFVRRDLNFTFQILDSEYLDRLGQPKPYVKLQVFARYKVRNVSNGPETLSLGISLPNPMIDELKPKCDVTKFTVRSADGSFDYDLAPARAEFRKKLENDSVSEVPFLVDKVLFKANEEKDVTVEYHAAKEEEDVEVMQLGYPTDSVVITIVDKGKLPRIMRAKAIHPATLDKISGGEFEGPYVYRLDRYLLPHQGFALWWKLLPPNPRTGQVSPQIGRDAGSG